MKNLIQTAQRALKAGTSEKGVDLLCQAVRKDTLNSQLIITAVMLLKDHGEYDAAFTILQQYVGAGGTQPEVLEIMALLSMDLRVYDVAIKLLDILIEKAPSIPHHYVNYCDCLVKLGRTDEAIQLLQNLLPQMPDASALWNTLATILSEEIGDKAAAEPFYQEAYRLDPENFNLVNNLGNYYSGSPKCYEYYEKAISIEPDNPLPRIGLATRMFLDERWCFAYPHYEYRLTPNQGIAKTPTYEHPGNIWTGESLRGKSILVMAEQGLGDELFFALNYRRLCVETDKVVISCDPRLTGVFERSFPSATIISYQDRLNGAVRHRSFPHFDTHSPTDYAVHAGSLMQYFWRMPDNVAPLLRPLLLPSPQKAAAMSKVMNNNSKNINIGLSWRSGNQKGERKGGYLDIETYAPLLTLEGISFYSLQYDLTDEERVEIETRFPQIQIFDGVDLKADIEANLAIMANLDLIIGPGTATQMLAILSGRPTCYLVKGMPWWASWRLRRDGPYFAPHCTWHYFLHDDWWHAVRDNILSLHSPKKQQAVS